MPAAATTTTWVDITRAVPWHEVRDEQKLAALTADMAARGWKGRALAAIAVEHGGGPPVMMLITGSHRYAAAVAAGIRRIPVSYVHVEDIDTDEDVIEEMASMDDTRKVVYLHQIGLTALARLVAREN